MKLASFTIQDRATWGIVEGPSVLDLGSVLAPSYPDLRSWIAQADVNGKRDATASAQRYDINDISWLPVIPNPEKIFCVGLNYEMHRKETGRSMSFTRRSSPDWRTHRPAT